jgi:hypothetical protein
MVIAFVSVAFISTGAIGDGDVWWQMAYGKYLLDQGTLIPDHSVFSWTEASNVIIYCAWLAEITLYAIHDVFGIKGLFGMRYFAMLLPMALLLWLGHRQKSQPPALVWLAFLICYLMSYTSGGAIKPELFSFMFMSVTVANYFAMKRDDELAWKLSYVFPVVILLWANTHGGVVIGMVFLGAVACGEMLNYFSRGPAALNLKTIRHLAIAAALSLIAMFGTPYGWDYPLSLARSALSLNHQEYSTVLAYHNIFSSKVAHSFFPLYLYLSAALVIPLLIEQLTRRRLDFVLLLIIVLFMAAYVRYIRMTYFYALVMLFTFQYMLASSPGWKFISANRPKRAEIAIWLSVVLMIGLSGHRAISTLKNPGNNSSFSFGISNLNPVTEAEFISQHFSHQRLCNGYTGGGYLLWRLWPEQKVMIDPRYFPFVSWFDDWRQLKSGNDSELLSTFDCGVWSLNLGYLNLVKSLHSSPEWQLVFIGSSSVVFARKSSLTSQWSTQIGDDLLITSDPTTATRALLLLLNNKDFKLASELVASMDRRFQGTDDEPRIIKAIAYAEGLIAYYKRDYASAYALLRASQLTPAPITNRNLLIDVNQFLTQQLWESGRYADARDVALEGEKLAPNNAAILFNAGTLLLANPISNSDPLVWQKHLSKFLALSVEKPDYAPSRYLELASTIIKSQELTISSISPLRPIQRPPQLDPLSLYYSRR